MQILEYLDGTGRTPFGIWFDALDAPAAAKVTIALARIDQGNWSDVKGVGTGVLEYRIHFGPGYRIYFGRDGDSLVILLGGGTKPHSRRTSEWRSNGGLITSSVKSREGDMALTKDFKQTVKVRAERDAAFRQALLTEAVDQLLSGELETGTAVLRDYINATIGFEKLARETGTSPKSLMRMLGPKGNPRASNLLMVIGKLQRVAGVHLAVGAGS